MPWGRWVQTMLQSISSTMSQQANNATNAGKAVNGTMSLLSQQILNIQANVQAAIANVTVAPTQVTAGTFGAGVITPAANIGTGALPSGVTVTADVNVTNVTGANVRATNGPATNITATRVAGWLQSSDGLVGTASSSARYKTNIVDAATSGPAILGLSLKYYNYIAEIAKQQADPSYHVALEVGMLAEDLHAAGLWEFVVYQRDEENNLILDSAGQPIPDGIHYEIFSLGVLAAAQELNSQLIALTARVSKLEGVPAA